MTILNKFLLKFFLSVGVLTALTVEVHAEVITTCGESKGYGAYLRNGNLGPQGNFTPDGFRGSKITLEGEQDSGTGKTKVDVVFFNSGTPYRASKDGDVFLINHNPTNNTVNKQNNVARSSSANTTNGKLTFLPQARGQIVQQRTTTTTRTQSSSGGKITTNTVTTSKSTSQNNFTTPSKTTKKFVSTNQQFHQPEIFLLRK